MNTSQAKAWIGNKARLARQVTADAALRWQNPNIGTPAGHVERINELFGWGRPARQAGAAPEAGPEPGTGREPEAGHWS